MRGTHVALTDPMILRSISLFERLDDTEIADLAAHVEEASYLAGQTVFVSGDPGGTMLIVRSGRVEISVRDSSGHRVVLNEMKPGEFFGELSLLDGEVRSTDARAAENTRLIVVPRDALERLVEVHPNAVLDLLAVLGQRLRKSTLMVQERAVRNINEEIQHTENFIDRLSNRLVLTAGNMRFTSLNILFFVVWVIINSGLVVGLRAFDPYPFGLLALVVSMEAILLSLFILTTQNRQAAHEKVRNDIQYEANLNAELGVRELRREFENLQRVIIEHLADIHPEGQSPPH